MTRPWAAYIKKTEMLGRTIFNITDILHDPPEERFFDVVVCDGNFNSASAFEVIDDKQHSLSIEDTETIIEKYKLKDIQKTYTVRWNNV